MPSAQVLGRTRNDKNALAGTSWHAGARVEGLRIECQERSARGAKGLCQAEQIIQGGQPRSLCGSEHAGMSQRPWPWPCPRVCPQVKTTVGAQQHETQTLDSADALGTGGQVRQVEVDAGVGAVCSCSRRRVVFCGLPRQVLHQTAGSLAAQGRRLASRRGGHAARLAVNSANGSACRAASRPGIVSIFAQNASVPQRPRSAMHAQRAPARPARIYGRTRACPFDGTSFASLHSVLVNLRARKLCFWRSCCLRTLAFRRLSLISHYHAYFYLNRPRGRTCPWSDGRLQRCAQDRRLLQVVHQHQQPQLVDQRLVPSDVCL